MADGWGVLRHLIDNGNVAKAMSSLSEKAFMDLVADAERATQIKEPEDHRAEIFKKLNLIEDSFDSQDDRIFVLKGLAYAASWIISQENQWRRTGSDTSPQRYFYWRLSRILKGTVKIEIPKTPEVSDAILN